MQNGIVLLTSSATGKTRDSIFAFYWLLIEVAFWDSLFCLRICWRFSSAPGVRPLRLQQWSLEWIPPGPQQTASFITFLPQKKPSPNTVPIFLILSLQKKRWRSVQPYCFLDITQTKIKTIMPSFTQKDSS